MMARKPPFEADLDPEMGWPRLRLNFANGWTGSIALRTKRNGMDAQLASLACFPTGKHGQGLTELGETEANPEEAAAWLLAISQRATVAPESLG